MAQSNRVNKVGFLIIAPEIFGSYTEGNKLKIFVTIYDSFYQLYDKVLSETGGSVVPVAMTFTKNTDGSYSLDDFKYAKDGTEFAPSIRDYCTMPVSGKTINGLADRIINRYGNHDALAKLERKNLIQLLEENNQTGIQFHSPGGEMIPLT